MSNIWQGGPSKKLANLQIGNNLWIDKFAWITTRDFMYWHRDQEYIGGNINADIYTAGKILLGEKYRYCDMTCMPAEMADKTNISYRDKDFLLLLLEYYTEEKLDPFENVNKLYELYPAVSKLDRLISSREYCMELLALIKNTTHITGKSFLIKILSDKYFSEGSKSMAAALLESMPHERRRSYAFLQLTSHYVRGADIDLEFFYRMLGNITHPVDKNLALKEEFVVLAFAQQWEKAFASFISQLSVRTQNDFEHLLHLFLEFGERNLLFELLRIYVEKLENENNYFDVDDVSLNILSEALSKGGVEKYSKKINQLLTIREEVCRKGCEIEGFF